MALEFLTDGSPATKNANQATQSTLPDWYNSYIQGVASKATDIAAQPYVNYPGQQVADFNDTQRNAFDLVDQNVGNYAPYIDSASSAFGASSGYGSGAVGAAGGNPSGAMGQAAMNAVAGPAQSWVDPGTFQKYMSPYTSSVVDEIGRLGNQNLLQNIIPQTQANFVGSGQFGSTRNAQILGQNVRDTQSNISGLQSNALQSGYNTAANIFGADANRAQQQGSLQANAAIGAGGLANTAASNAVQANLGAGQLANQAGTGMSALAQMRQALGMNDVTALGAAGGQQQALEQSAYDKSVANFDAQRNWDWTQLGKVQSAVNGVQLPTGQTASTSATSAPAGTSPLQWLTAIGGLYKAINP